MRRSIPTIIMLIAAIITCVISIYNQYDMDYFITLLIIVLLVFYILGMVVKAVLDKILVEKNESLEELEELEETKAD